MATENDDSKSKMEDYAIMELIGRGALGATFLVLHKTENKKCVLKKIRLSKQTEKFKTKAFQEMDLIAKLRHPYLLECKDAWVDKGSCICIVTDYCEVGNISDVVRKARGAYFSEEKVCKWLTQLLLAINYLHSNRVLHRDLKLSNIFVTKENDIRLGDFGLAKLLNEEGLASSVAGTPNYICPEIVANTPYGYKSDIWSLGCLMFEIAAHQQAFRAPDMTGLINKINRSLISPMPIVYSSTLKQIIKSMLRKSPEHRPTAAELLRHPHLQPFLLRCDNPSTVFLPVKSPSPNNANDRTKSPSPSSPINGKSPRGRSSKLKQRELLPLFDETSNMQYTSLLDGDALIEDLLETKRVDPTSYSGKISQDSEDSKSGGTCETTACNGDDLDDPSSIQESVYTIDDALKRPSNAVCEEQDKCSPKNTTKSGEEPPCSPELNQETKTREEGTILDTVLTDSEDSKSGGTACNGDDLDNCDSSSLQESVYTIDDAPKRPVREEDECSPKNTTEVEKETEMTKTGEEPPCTPDSTEETKTQAEGTILDTVLDKEMPLVEDNSRSEVDAEPVSSSSCLDKDQVQDISRKTEKETINDLLLSAQAAIGSKGSSENPEQHRAEALESLLELCARLLKQDKFDELSGVLKAFGEDTVSSRETAIWLTKSLMNAQKLAKDS